jgi:hypothetical protein
MAHADDTKTTRLIGVALILFAIAFNLPYA